MQLIIKWRAGAIYSNLIPPKVSTLEDTRTSKAVGCPSPYAWSINESHILNSLCSHDFGVTVTSTVSAAIILLILVKILPFCTCPHMRALFTAFKRNQISVFLCHNNNLKQ